MEPSSQSSLKDLKRAQDAKRKREERAKRTAVGDAAPKRPPTSLTPKEADAERKRKQRMVGGAEQEARRAADAKRKREERANRAAFGHVPYKDDPREVQRKRAEHSLEYESYTSLREASVKDKLEMKHAQAAAFDEDVSKEQETGATNPTPSGDGAVASFARDGLYRTPSEFIRKLVADLPPNKAAYEAADSVRSQLR